MKSKAITIAVTLGLLGGCAAQKRQVMTWAPGGAASVPQEQALAQCSVEVGDNERNFDRLFLLSGQPKFGPYGVQGLSPQGRQLFEMCMLGKGYRPSGAVTVDD